MRSIILAAGVLCAGLSPSSAAAGIFTDDFSRCLVRSATPEDRQALLRWLFLAAAANPALDGLVEVSETNRDVFNRAAASVFNRLLLDACRADAVAAIRNEGVGAVEAGFRTLGELAGREMMNTPQGRAHMAELDRFLDTNGMEALGTEAGIAPAAEAGGPGTTP